MELSVQAGSTLDLLRGALFSPSILQGNRVSRYKEQTLLLQFPLERKNSSGCIMGGIFDALQKTPVAKTSQERQASRIGAHFVSEIFLVYTDALTGK